MNNKPVTRKTFWTYCNNECPHFHVGCAKTCDLRKRFKIPPHGEHYEFEEDEEEKQEAKP